MADCLRALDDRVLVEYGVFGLMDLDTAACPRPWPQEPLADSSVSAMQNRVDFPSAAPDHEAAVRLETWSDEPPPTRDGWEDEDEVEVALTSGEVQLWAVTMGPGQPFVVGPAGRYRLRVSSRGHEAAATLHMTGRRVPDGTERYLLRFWPAG